jgi:UDP:flavonoid glycosyltransferase YjiC (YdhE family)
MRGGAALSQNGGRGFLDAAASAFLRRRLHSRRLRAAAMRGLKVVSAGTGGRLQMDFDDPAERLAHLPPWLAAHASEMAAAPAPDEPRQVPPLSIVIMIVGSRGDVQPFIPIARKLAERHRVRIATHREFRPMVERAGLEFYPLGGDPHALMEYIVKTGGRIVPTRLDQIVEDVPKKRAMIAEILASTWRACTEPDPDRPDAPAFRADVILANPPSYGHIHCAEALHVPLHLIFTMPWTATSAVPHPFAGIEPGAHRPVRNFLSYGVVDLLVWSGIADLVNAFREQTLGLPPITLADGAAALEDNEVPFTYLWPASLVPKPADWGPHIDVANFIFYDQALDYEPPPALMDFLAAGEAPIYVGFGSVVVQEPAALRRMVFTALEKAGVRGIVSDGWAHLGGEDPPANVFLIGDCPHDWLFRHCRAVCHHGGAGTTAAGLRAGLPTVVVPFFGDKFFWGRVVADAGAGPEPIPIDRLDSDALARAFEACRLAEVRERASALGTAVRATDGVELAVRSVYRHLPARATYHVNGPDHRATVPRDSGGKRSSGDGGPTAHFAQLVGPRRYVDWGGHPGRGLAEEMGELIGDAAWALQAGLREILPRKGPWREATAFSDGKELSSADERDISASAGCQRGAQPAQAPER